MEEVNYMFKNKSSSYLDKMSHLDEAIETLLRSMNRKKEDEQYQKELYKIRKILISNAIVLMKREQTEQRAE